MLKFFKVKGGNEDFLLASSLSGLLFRFIYVNLQPVCSYLVQSDVEICDFLSLIICKVKALGLVHYLNN